MPQLVYISARKPGILFANGTSLGALGAEPLAVRPKEGAAQLQFFPLGLNQGVSSAVLHVEGERLSAEGAVLRLWPGGQLELCLYEGEEPADPRLGLAEAFLAALRDDQWQQATLAMSQGLRQSVRPEILQNFLGRFDGAEAPGFIEGAEEDGSLPLATYVEQNGQRRMRLFRFDFTLENGLPFIDNIRAFIN
ncbi:MAG: hypothetical protein LBU47_04335 [Christensenellaceae bacterium]|jgi:hypothetical protein|nr:hypothetical protein [Christensenellaceae bacterium]